MNGQDIPTTEASAVALAGERAQTALDLLLLQNQR